MSEKKRCLFHGEILLGNLNFGGAHEPAGITHDVGVLIHQEGVVGLNATSGVKADNTFLVYQDTYIMGDPGWFMHATEVEVPEKYFTVK